LKKKIKKSQDIRQVNPKEAREGKKKNDGRAPRMWICFLTKGVNMQLGLWE
jgi:hypothetical protein